MRLDTAGPAPANVLTIDTILAAFGRPSSCSFLMVIAIDRPRPSFNTAKRGKDLTMGFMKGLASVSPRSNAIAVVIRSAV